MEINIKIIPYKEQRYPTVGDWWRDENNDIQIRVNNLGDIRKEAMIAIHELTEMLLCEQRGITEEEVSAFDIEYEKNRPDGNDDEPGDDPRAPNKNEHFFATTVEMLLANQFGVDWATYDKEVNDSCI